MSTDAPDDFDYSNVGEFTANLDSSELAARLYSPLIYARSGQVLFMTDFSRGFSGLFVTDNLPSDTVSLVNDYSLTSGLAVKLANTSTTEGNTALTNTIPFVEARYYTLDLSFYCGDGNGIFHGYLLVTQESVRHWLEFEYTFDPFRLRVKNSGASWVDITSYESSSSVFGGLAHLRITIDTQEGLFKELLLNGVSFDVSAISYYKPTVSSYNAIQLSLYFAKEGGVSSTMYISYIVITLSDS